jgi:demethoxyubiquinone hydroxylase (CLK1/Coq7/Cat5 family)
MLDTDRELDLLNFYRASELHGGLILAQIVRRVRDPRLVLALTRHAAEEIVHAQCWTETLLTLGGTPRPVRDTYQARYARALRAPVSVFHVLALTQVFERRVFRHFTLHLRRPGTHPAICATLRRLLDEERDHLSWVKTWLDEQEKSRGRELVTRTMHEFAEADETIYAEQCDEYGFARAA